MSIFFMERFLHCLCFEIFHCQMTIIANPNYRTLEQELSYIEGRNFFCNQLLYKGF